MLKRSTERCVNIRERSGAGAEPERSGVERCVNIRERSRSGAGAEGRGAERSQYEYRCLSGARSDV